MRADQPTQQAPRDAPGAPPTWPPNDPGALPGLPAILSVIAQIPVSEAILDSAAMFPEPLLRSLDAIHLASAQSITAVTAVLAYDKHLIDAARNAGLTVASPA